MKFNLLMMFLCRQRRENGFVGQQQGLKFPSKLFFSLENNPIIIESNSLVDAKIELKSFYLHGNNRQKSSSLSNASESLHQEKLNLEYFLSLKLPFSNFHSENTLRKQDNIEMRFS
ncbi:CLUMA_CG020690, isoform A [Clunio marinus]|uniref:CLUMA_CG020690, isoform A n=1 Tax=Clunio marinus TaxID=568069 RepID=A0A1J1J5Q9_9DIPT|nr:CLUMA_CG020690, isoform A [Clunio marinus]